MVSTKSSYRRRRVADKPAAIHQPWLPGLVAAVASGLMIAAAFPGPSLWPLAIVGWLPLLSWVRWHRPTARRAGLMGFLAGTIVHIAVFYWVASTLEEMSGLPAAASALALVVYGAVMGLHQGLWLALLVRFAPVQAGDECVGVRRLRWAGLAAVIYLAVEVLVPFQFPWFLGNALYAAPIWLQAADVAGVVGVSALCIFVAALLAEAALWRPARRSVAPMAAALVCLLLWSGYGLTRVAMHDAAPVHKRWTAAIIQPNPSLAEKRSLRPTPRLPMLDRAIELTDGLDLSKVDVVVWPEGSLPFFYVPLPGDPDAGGLTAEAMRAPPVLLHTTRRVREFAAGLGRPLIFGALRRTDPLWRERARNAAVIITPDGRRRFYDKQLLVPFGEYMPGRDLVPALTDAIPGISNMGAGSGGAQFDLGGARVALTICYEALFAGHVWRAAGDADVLLNLTDDVWFGPTNAPELHLMVQAARAVELRRPLVRATATGISALVDAAGRVRMRTGIWRTDARIVTAEVPVMDSAYRYWGPWPARAIVALLCLWMLWRWRSRTPSAP